MVLLNNQTSKEYSSYKDPTGYILYFNDRVLRIVYPEYFNFYKELVSSSLFRELIEGKYVINTCILSKGEIPELSGLEENGVFEHDKVEFISYPYEWSTSMFIDAALHTLSLQVKLLSQNLSLKDASPFNIQFINCTPILIDLCSIEKVGHNVLWFAYNQFCQTFFYPILVNLFGKIPLSNLLITKLEGISLENAYEMLPWKPKIAFFMDLTVPMFIKKLSKNKTLKELDEKIIRFTADVSKDSTIQISNLKRLHRLINQQKTRKSSSTWSSYYSAYSPYSKDSEVKKIESVREFFEEHRVFRVMDIGCNTGLYSKIAAEYGCFVLAVDSDPDCVNDLYVYAKKRSLNILTLCIDISNPSPSVGWSNKERKSFLERCHFDCIISLALVHHLLISNKQPIERIVELMSTLTSKYLITEFVGKDDEKFKTLTMNRREHYDYFTLDFFKRAHGEKFKILKELPLPGLDRTLFIMEKL